MAAEAARSPCAVGGLLATWMFAEARVHLGETLSTASMRGFERSVRTLAVHEQVVEGSPSNIGLHCVFGLAAARRLAALGIDIPASLGALLRERIEAISLLVGLSTDTSDWTDAHLLPLIVSPEMDDRTRMMRPVTLLALRAIREEGLACSVRGLLDRIEGCSA